MKEEIEKREKIEWLNYWIEDAGEQKSRILLIGDSVTRQYRKCMNNILKVQGYVVDIIAMSFCVCDSRAEEELAHFVRISDYRYDYIVIHLGCHHGYWLECRNNEKHASIYRKCVSNIIDLFVAKYAKVIIVSGTPERGDTKEEKTHNEEIKTRNSIWHNIAEEKDIVYLDLYKGILGKKVKYTDWCHFSRSIDEYIANRIIETIFGGQRNELYNLVDSMIDFNKIGKIYEGVYIYGNGNKGQIMYKYLKLSNIRFYGYIVSPQFYCGEMNTFVLRDIVPIRSNALIIVTPSDYNIYEELAWSGGQYISLSDRLYIFFEEYVNAYMEDDI